MWFAYFLNYSDRQAIFAMFPVLKTELQFSDSQLGLVGAVFLWVYGFGCPIAGLVADRYSKRWLVIGSLAIWSIVTIATGLVNSVTMMLVLRACMGISESMYMPAAVSLTANAHAPHQRSRAVAILTTAQIVGTFAGGTFGGLMAGYGAWRIAFFLLGGIGLLYVLPYWAFLRTFDERAVDESNDVKVDGQVATDHSSLRSLGLEMRTFDERAVNESNNVKVHEETRAFDGQVATDPSSLRSLGLENRATLAATYLLLCAVFPVFVFGLWMLYAWLPNFIFEKFKLSLGQSAFVATSTLQASMLVGLVAGGLIADALFKLYRSARLWLLVISLLICAPSLYFIGNAETVFVTSLSAGVFGLMGGFFAGNIFPAAFEVVASHKRASAVGWLNFCGAMLSGFAPLIGGLFKQRIGLEGLLTATACAYLVAALSLSIGIIRWYPRDYERAH